MHEMAIAEGILDIALDYAQKNGAARIERIGLLLGELSGVETDSLSLCFSSLTADTIAADAVLTWERVPPHGALSRLRQGAAHPSAGLPLPPLWRRNGDHRRPRDARGLYRDGIER